MIPQNAEEESVFWKNTQASHLVDEVVCRDRTVDLMFLAHSWSHEGLLQILPQQWELKRSLHLLRCAEELKSKLEQPYQHYTNVSKY